MFSNNVARAPWNLVEQRAELEKLLEQKGGPEILTRLPPVEGRFP
jgi:hypothetical protein